MNRRNAVALLVAALVASTSWAADNPRVAALKAEIKTLKEQEVATKKKIHAWYERFIKRDAFTEEVLKEERAALLLQEELLLSVTVATEDRRLIRAHYETLREYLRLDIKLDAAQIARLRNLQKAHETYVVNAYKAKIAQLEAQAKAAAQTPKPPKK